MSPDLENLKGCKLLFDVGNPEHCGYEFRIKSANGKRSSQKMAAGVCLYAENGTVNIELGLNINGASEDISELLANTHYSHVEVRVLVSTSRFRGVITSAAEQIEIAKAESNGEI